MCNGVRASSTLHLIASETGGERRVKTPLNVFSTLDETEDKLRAGMLSANRMMRWCDGAVPQCTAIDALAYLSHKVAGRV